MDDLHSPASMKTASALALEERRKKGRVRHLPHQTAALNEVFDRTDHPSLQERTALGKQLGMETKVVNSWFQNKRAALRKRAEREVSEPVVTPRQSEPPATPQEDPLPPRSQHPSLPPISALLQRPAHHGSSGDESDVDEDDEMPVRLPPIQIAPGMRTAFGNAASEHDRLPDLYMGPEPSLSVSSSRHPQSVSYYAPRSVSAPYSAAPAAHALLSKRSFNEEDFPHRPSYPPPSSLHPSLRAAYPSPIPHPHLLPELTFSEPSRSYGSLGYSRGTSDGSRTPSSVYADDLVNRELPPLIQFGRTADDEVTSYRNRKLDDGHPIDPWAAPSLPPQHNGYKMRKRPSTHQLEELRRVYEATSHPSREERVRLAEETGLKPQSITNWFQNQRSLAKRRRGGAAHESLSADSPMPSPSEPDARGFSLAEGRFPAGARPRRSRPEPYQLEALKKLYEETSSPSIEQRGALALEVGMEVSKVTNWFRNLRQTAKKRARGAPGARDGARPGQDDEDFDMDAEDEAGSRGSGSAGSRDGSIAGFSRDVTPAGTFASPTESVDDYHMRGPERREYAHYREKMDVEDHGSVSHETGSDEEEAVTPSPHVASPSLPSFPGLMRREAPVAKQYSSAPTEEQVKKAASMADAELLLGLRTRASPNDR